MTKNKEFVKFDNVDKSYDGKILVVKGLNLDIEEVGYSYPKAYIRYFGPDFTPEPYVAKDAEYAKNHKWYMSARQITMNDAYSFDPNIVAKIEDFEDIIGRHFKQPEEGLGYDNSPSAHMWRTMIFPNNFL